MLTEKEKERLVTEVAEKTGVAEDTVIGAAHLAKITGDIDFAVEFIKRSPDYRDPAIPQ